MFMLSIKREISRALTAKKCTKKRDARAELLFCQTTETYCFLDVLVAVAVVTS